MNGLTQLREQPEVGPDGQPAKFPPGDKAAELPGMDRGTTEKLLSSPCRQDVRGHTTGGPAGLLGAWLPTRASQAPALTIHSAPPPTHCLSGRHAGHREGRGAQPLLAASHPTLNDAHFYALSAPPNPMTLAFGGHGRRTRCVHSPSIQRVN